MKSFIILSWILLSYCSGMFVQSSVQSIFSCVFPYKFISVDVYRIEHTIIQTDFVDSKRFHFVESSCYSIVYSSNYVFAKTHLYIYVQDLYLRLSPLFPGLMCLLLTVAHRFS